MSQIRCSQIASIIEAMNQECKGLSWKFCAGVTGRCASALSTITVMMVLGCGKKDDQASGTSVGKPGGTRSAYLASRPIQTVNGPVDFGAVKPCGDPVTRTVKVRNESNDTVEILACSSNCGCLSAKFIGSKTLAPKDEREVELTVHPSGRGNRSIAVEFAYNQGFAGSIRADFSLDSGVQAIPPMQDVHAGDRDTAVETSVKANDGKKIKVLSIDPPVGSIGADGNVDLSSFEAMQFASSEAGRKHPGVVMGADGKPESLTVFIITDHPDCPKATFDFIFKR